uniref:Secreted protein n=1 Tax=Anguilla anguilla TaxID=7936 RepID=A0A0E9R8K1_ANGAN
MVLQLLLLSVVLCEGSTIQWVNVLMTVGCRFYYFIGNFTVAHFSRDLHLNCLGKYPAVYMNGQCLNSRLAGSSKLMLDFFHRMHCRTRLCSHVYKDCQIMRLVHFT